MVALQCGLIEDYSEWTTPNNLWGFKQPILLPQLYSSENNISFLSSSFIHVLFWWHVAFEPVANRPPSGLRDKETGRGTFPQVFVIKQQPQTSPSPPRLALSWGKKLFSSVSRNWLLLPFAPPSFAWKRWKCVGMQAGVIKYFLLWNQTQDVPSLQGSRLLSRNKMHLIFSFPKLKKRTLQIGVIDAETYFYPLVESWGTNTLSRKYSSPRGVQPQKRSVSSS